MVWGGGVWCEGQGECDSHMCLLMRTCLLLSFAVKEPTQFWHERTPSTQLPQAHFNPAQLHVLKQQQREPDLTYSLFGSFRKTPLRNIAACWGHNAAPAYASNVSSLVCGYANHTLLVLPVRPLLSTQKQWQKVDIDNQWPMKKAEILSLKRKNLNIVFEKHSKIIPS